MARHSIDAFARISPTPAVCLVGYRHTEVSAALGTDNIYVRSENPTGGTAFAAFEAFSVPGLLEANPLIAITMGDRIVPSSIFRRLWKTHHSGHCQADLTFLSAVYEPPKNRGKGRVLRNDHGSVLEIVEERDILQRPDDPTRQRMLDITEGNCPLYLIRAATLHHYLQAITNDNAQGQYYITDIISALSRDGGDIRTVTTTVTDPEYDLLCSDVTRPMDLALLEGILASGSGLLSVEERQARQIAETIASDRPGGQVASIARQLNELDTAIVSEQLGFDPDRPVAIGISGGRLRIAFMHPDMGRFYGPAWQMPIGAAADPTGAEQITS